MVCPAGRQRIRRRASVRFRFDSPLSTSAPDRFFLLSLTHLLCTQLRENRLSSLPATIGQLTALTRLCLWRNRLARLPREVGLLRLLRDLDVSSNALDVMPGELGDLQALERLDVLICHFFATLSDVRVRP